MLAGVSDDYWLFMISGWYTARQICNMVAELILWAWSNKACRALLMWNPDWATIVLIDCSSHIRLLWLPLIPAFSDILMMRVLALYSKGKRRKQCRASNLTPILDRILSISLPSLLILAAAIKLAILIYITVIQESACFWPFPLYHVSYHDHDEVAVYSIANDVTICGERKSAAIGWGIVDWYVGTLLFRHEFTNIFSIGLLPWHTASSS